MSKSRIIYVLNETEKDGSSSIIGVFDKSELNEEKLSEYYDNSLIIKETIDIQDSGIVWQKRIIVNGIYGLLTMQYFIVGEY
jgi:hypothetical protein